MITVHTTSEKFENGGFTLKIQQMFFRAYDSGEITATITDHFGFVFEENMDREIRRLSRHRFRKTPFSKYLPSTLKRKAGVFKFLWFE